jgi:hypothetical protein
MHFLFNLLRIKSFYIFRALLAHPQQVLHKRHLVYCVRVMSVGCTRINVEPRGMNSYELSPSKTLSTALPYVAHLSSGYPLYPNFFFHCHHMSLMDFVAEV